MSNIKDCFEAIRQLKDKQLSQKARGLNDYNIVNVVRKANHEVGMHSNVIYSLINPNGLHYQGYLFLNLFIKHVLKITDFGTVYEVQAEEVTSSLDKNKRIDFTIKSDKFVVGIEMKVDHHDSNMQLYNYNQDLNNKANDDNNQKVVIYYLTKNGKKASQESSNGINYITISFEENILDWINVCQKEVRNITNLNEAFENYRVIVQKITKKYKSKVVNMNEFLQEEDNIKFLQEVFEIKNNVHEMLGKKLFELIQNIDEYVNHIIEKIEPSNKKENIYNQGKCTSWFYNNEKHLKGLQKTECIGSFYKLTNTILLRVEVATHNLHVGLVSYIKDGDNYKIVNRTPELDKIAIKNKDLECRNWRWVNWYSIDCGTFIALTEKNQECYKNFEDCFLKKTIEKLINFIQEESKNDPI